MEIEEDDFQEEMMDTISQSQGQKYNSDMDTF